jgi:hypothetical protein
VAAAPLDLLFEAAKQTTPQALNQYVFSNPILLKPDIRADLRKAVETAAMDQGQRQHASALLDILQSFWDTLAAAPAKYPVGPGPLEVLEQRAAQGEISSDTAEKLAADPNISAALSPPYLIKLSNYCRDGAQQGKWRQAMPRHRIIQAAAAALPATEAWQNVRDELDLDWIDIVHGALMDVPDGRWLTAALAVGDRVVTRAKSKNPPDDALLGEASFRLGTMYLDPYTARFTSINYKSQIEEWHWRLRDELGKAITWIPQAELKMPEPAKALQQAIVHLSEAVRLRPPALKPFAVKALDQAIIWLKIAGGTVDPEVAALAERAGQEILAQIDRAANPDVWVAMFAQLASQDKTLDYGQLTELLKTPLDDFIARIGGLQTASLVSHAAQALASPDPARSLELYRLAAPVMARYADPKMRANWYEMELNVIQAGLAAPLPNRPAADISTGQIAAALKTEAASQTWGPTRLAASLLALAGGSGAASEEAAGLRLLEEAKNLAPVFCENHAGAFELLRARLLLDDGVNFYQTGDWPGAITGYGQSLAGFLHLRLDDSAMKALRRLRDVAAKATVPVAQEIATVLMPLALRIEANLGDPGRSLVIAACQDAAATAVAARGDTNIISLVWQMAKGLRFSAALTKGISRLTGGAEGAALLAQIAAFPAALRVGGADVETSLNEVVLLSPYVRRPAASGEADADRLANLQQQFDAFVTDRLMSGPVQDDPPYADIDAIQASLDERTVLIICFLSANAARQPRVHMLAITREARRMEGVDWSVGGMTGDLVIDGFEVDTSPIASTVWGLRARIQDYAGPDESLSEAAAGLLDTGLAGYLGNLPSYLAKQRAAGKNHLCIVPHGPLHFLPFHAIRENGKPLAETWAITYLPNLGLLFGYRGGPTIPPARDAEMTSIGLTFQTSNPFNLPPMPQSGTEASAVAALFNTKPVLDEAATETQVMQALQHSHYVHLSTHGRHNTAAPAFQNLFFTPGETTDGMLHAYEILNLDLRGIDILTLSACETALGRFDEGDNLRGLPASFLLAGVSTLIGTLWEVDAAASEKFFVTFYTQIKSGADRRDAFWQAQRQTRAAFPRYAHWAAFYFIGSWK